MVILIYGQDTYRSRQKLAEIVGHYKKSKKSLLNLRYFDGDELKIEELEDEISQVSMFSEKKLLIVKNFFPNAEPKEKSLKTLKRFAVSEDTIIFYQEGEVQKSNSSFTFLKKSGKTQEFEFLEKGPLRLWIKKEFEKKKAKISPGVIDKLIDSAGNDSWRLSNEIQKLASYRISENVQITDVDLLVKPKIETAIFKTIDAISQKNRKQALLLLHRHLEQGDKPTYLLSMINFQFRNLLVVKDLIEKHIPYPAILKKTRLHPFVVKKSFQQADKFTLSQLKKIYRRIFQADLDIKTGRIKPETALDLLIAEIGR